MINQTDLTIKCIQSLIDNTVYIFELILIDNGSDKQHIHTIVDYVAGHLPRHSLPMQLIQNKTNLGFIKATNQGLQQATCEFVVLLNNDTAVTQGWDDKMLHTFDLFPNVGAVGPVTQSIIGWQNAERIKAIWGVTVPMYNKQTHAEYNKQLEDKSDPKYLPIGNTPLAFFCAMLRKSTVDEVGLLCEDFKIGLGDDDEYCIHLRSHGYSQYVALNTFVYHKHRTTFNALKLDINSIRAHNLQVLRKKEAELRKKTTK